jgi:hypothetical protein
VNPVPPALSPLEHRAQATVLNGQRVYLLDADLMGELLETPELAGRPLGVGRLFAQFVALAQQTPGVRVALGEAREANKPFILCHVVEVAGALRRVVLEGQTCFSCGWRGVTGNARDLALYEGCPAPFEQVQAALAEPSLACPSCYASLVRACIWLHTAAEGHRVSNRGAE